MAQPFLSRIETYIRECWRLVVFFFNHRKIGGSVDRVVKEDEVSKVSKFNIEFVIKNAREGEEY